MAYKTVWRIDTIVPSFAPAIEDDLRPLRVKSGHDPYTSWGFPLQLAAVKSYFTVTKCKILFINLRNIFEKNTLYHVLLQQIRQWYIHTRHLATILLYLATSHYIHLHLATCSAHVQPGWEVPASSKKDTYAFQLVPLCCLTRRACVVIWMV